MQLHSFLRQFLCVSALAAVSLGLLQSALAQNNNLINQQIFIEPRSLGSSQKLNELFDKYDAEIVKDLGPADPKILKIFHFATIQ